MNKFAICPYGEIHSSRLARVSICLACLNLLNYFSCQNIPIDGYAGWSDIDTFTVCSGGSGMANRPQ